VGDVHDVTAAKYVTATNLDDTLPMGDPVDEGTDETDILLHNRYGRPALSALDINTPGDDWKDPARPDHDAGDFFCTQRGPTHVVGFTRPRPASLRCTDDGIVHQLVRRNPLDVGKHAALERVGRLDHDHYITVCGST